MHLQPGIRPGLRWGISQPSPDPLAGLVEGRAGRGRERRGGGRERKESGWRIGEGRTPRN